MGKSCALQALLIAIASGAILPTAVMGQAPPAPGLEGPTAEGRQLEEVVITARKREEGLMTVPVAVTAVSSQQLAKTGAVGLAQIAQLAPQVMVSRADSGSGASFNIRGIGTPFADQGTEQSVTVNIDGVPASRGNVVSTGFFDLQQVEVLKGPQALFFGKNSPAGVISLRSKNPTDKLEGYVRTGYEAYAKEGYGEGAIGGPITDALKMRIAIRGSKMQGWLHNTAEPTATPLQLYPTTGRVASGNGGTELLGRMTVLYEPAGGNFDANLKFSGGSFKDHGGTGQVVCDPPTAIPVTSGVPDPHSDCKLDRYYQSTGIDPRLTQIWPGGRDGFPYTDSRSLLVAFTMNYRLPHLTITSVTGYLDINFKQLVDFTYGNYGTAQVPFGEKSRSITQEVRMVSDYNKRVNFTLGAFFDDTKRTNYTGAYLAPFVGWPTQLDPTTGRYENYDNIESNKGNTASAFGQLRFKLLQHLELAGGVRYTQEWKDTRLGTTYSNMTPVPLGPGVAVPKSVLFGIRDPGDIITGHFSDNNWSPEVTLSWTPISDLLVYAAYKNGYKSGGFSNPNLLQTFQNSKNLAFNSEKSDGYEIGVKAFLADRTVKIEFAAYDYRYSNLQVSSFDQQTFSYFIKNAATARVKGTELSGQWRATQALTLNATGTFNEAKYSSFPNGQCYNGEPCPTGFQDLTGRALTHAPRWTLSGGASYDTPISSSLMLGLSADANYTSSYFTSEDHAPVSRQPGFTLINAGARIYTQDDRWEFAIIGRNLANKYYMVTDTSKPLADPSGREYVAYTPRTREVRAQLSYNF